MSDGYRRVVLHGAMLLVAVVLVAPAHAQGDLDSARVLMRRQRFPEVRALLDAAPSAARARTREDSLRWADLADLRAELAWRDRANMPADADAVGRAAVALRSRLHGPRSVEVATTLTHLGRIQRYSNRTDSALVTLSRANAILAEIPDREAELATGLVAIGLLRRDRGDFLESADALERAVEIRRRVLGSNSRELAGALINLAVVRDLMGDRAKGILEEREAIGIYDRQVPLDSANFALALGNHAGSLAQLKQWPEALAMSERFAAIVRASALPPRQQLLAAELLGRTLSAVGRVAEARAAFERGRAIAALGARMSPDAIPTFWGQYAIFEREQTRLDSSLACVQRARAILEPDADNPALAGLVAQLQHEQGSTHLERGEFELARTEFMGAAAKYAARYGDAEYPGLPLLQHDWVVASYWSGHRDSLLEKELEADRMWSRHLRRVFDGLSEFDAMRYRGEASDFTRYALALAIEDPAGVPVERVWDGLIRSHAQVLDAMAARGRFLRALEDSTLRPLAREVELARQAETEALALSGPRRAERLRAAQERYRVADRALAERSRNYHRDLAQRDVGFAEVARALPRDAALVHYVRYTRWDGERTRRAVVDTVRAGGRALHAIDWTVHAGWSAFVVRGDDPTPRFVLLRGEETDTLLEKWADAMHADASRAPTSRSRMPIQVGKRLREVVWDPVAPLVAGARHVFIVPDADLYRVNLATLPDRGGNPLLETAPPFSLLSSPRDVVPAGEAPGASQGLLALGDPDFDQSAPEATVRRSTATSRAASECLLGGRQRFAPLPATRSEVMEVRRLSPYPRETSTVLVGETASRSAFLAGAPSHRTLHVATHGFFLTDSCLAPEESESPLLRVGLAFAGANGSSETALVTAAEIALLHLDHTELAVLSTCSSGAGRFIDGEGLYGMARAFALAGARTTVLSLNPVNDEIAARWITRFYEARWESGESAAEATRTASRAVRRELRSRGVPEHPAQWGAFIATGAGR